ncbi:MAG: type II CAAX prenyl endopeptidase Rce1 family protein [Pseudomonadales bacterium]
MDERSAMLVAGIGAVLLAGILSALGRHLDVPFSRPTVELMIFLFLHFTFPDQKGMKWGPRSTVSCVALGILLASLWVLFFAYPSIQRTEFKDLTDVPVLPLLQGLLSTALTAPLFEEKVARHLLLRGLGGLHYIASSVMVSALFAFAHKGAFLWAFLASMILCMTAIKLRMTTTQRAVSHGLCNVIITSWYFTGAFGLSVF